MNVRVRYAPSPTGFLHIGNVRTALFNYLFARSQGGSYILRIEDTDRERFREEYLADIYDTLSWLGLNWDEGPVSGGDYGPYIQSERMDLYRRYAEELVEKGQAYYCWCTSDRLAEVRERQKREKKKVIGYDRRCRDLNAEEQHTAAASGIEPVIRFKVPLSGTTEFNDNLLGKVKRDNIDINPDPVILKSDGFPTYHLANVIDDHLMGITHIMRAQEWLPSGPLHLLMYKAFGWEPPEYYHLPMVLGKDGSKLSKRHGATSMREFRTAGYLPEALINYMSLIGWSYDDSREFFKREELEKIFTLDKLNKAPGVFDYKKLDWFNGQYIRSLDPEDLKERLVPFLCRAGVVGSAPSPAEREKINRIIPLIQERLKKLADAPDMISFLFSETSPELRAEDLVPKRLDREKTGKVLQSFSDCLEGFEERSEEESEEILRNAAEELGVKLGDFMMPARVAITGSTVSPPLLGSVRILGVEESKQRLIRARKILAGD